MSSNGTAVRIGVIGVGRMGGLHARELASGGVPRAHLGALCDVDRAALAEFPSVPAFESSQELVRSGLVDAVLIATPHYGHAPIACDALGQGLHVLTEKPLGVHKAECERLLAAYERAPRPGQVFAEMLQLRADARYRLLRQLLGQGSLGRLVRVSFTVTDKFRTQAYYDSRAWRGTWRGEGGGLLLNQCLHELDLWQWLFGMPLRVRAFLGFGSEHRIETEDRASAWFDLAGGATGVFVASSGESPGSHRLEVVGDGGKATVEGDAVEIWKNARSVSEYVRFERDGNPAFTHERHELTRSPSLRGEVLANFVSAVLDGAPLLAPAVEGLGSVELANAMVASSLESRSVALPLDAEGYAALLERLKTASGAGFTQAHLTQNTVNASPPSSGVAGRTFST